MIGTLPLPYPFDAAFMERALVACLAVGVFAPMIGTFLVQRRLSLVGDGIGHVAFAGVGAGLLLSVWPVWTALAFAVAGAVGVEVLRTKRKASGDLALALFFYAGIALGVVFASRGGLPDFETLPVATAQLLARSFRATMRLAVGIGAASAVVGLGLARPLDVSPGGAIVLVAAALFAVVAVAKRTVPRGLPQEAR